MAPDPFDWTQLYLKAKIFIARSFRANDNGDDDEAALWAACALELLAKAALSKLNPLLIAHPDDDGTSLLAAAGVTSAASGVKTLPAKGTFARAAKAFPPFNRQTADRIAGNRNDELHSGSPGFAALPSEVWFAQYWAQADILLAALDKEVSDFVGHEHETLVEQHLERNKELVAQRTTALLERAKQRLAMSQRADATKQSLLDLHTAIERAENIVGSYTIVGGYIECPACEGDALIAGDDILQSEIEYDYEDFSSLPVESGEVLTEALGCELCGLSLDGHPLIVAAGVPEEFEFEREVEPDWDDYGND